MLHPKRLISADDHSCYIQKHGLNLSCWGNSVHNKTTVPAAILHQTSRIALGENHSCGIISTTNQLICWGDKYNYKITINHDNTTNYYRVQDGPGYGEFSIPSVAKYKSMDISSGYNVNCIITFQFKKLVCWGRDNFNQLKIPNKVQESSVDLVSVGTFLTCAIISTTCSLRSLQCWGLNTNNQLDIRPYYSSGVHHVHTSGKNVCAISVTKWLECWGYPQLGVNDVPLQYRDHIEWVEVTFYFACLLNSQGAFHCWGTNMYGVLDIPSEPKGYGYNKLEMSVGMGFACALKYDYKSGREYVECWGRNDLTQCQVSQAASHEDQFWNSVIDIPSSSGSTSGSDYTSSSGDKRTFDEIDFNHY